MISYDNVLTVTYIVQSIFLTVFVLLAHYKNHTEDFIFLLIGVVFIASISGAIVGLGCTIIDSELQILLCFSIPVLVVCAIAILISLSLEKYQHFFMRHVLAVGVLIFVIDIISIYGGVHKTNEVLRMTTVNISELSTLNKIRLAISIQKLVVREDSYQEIQNKVISNLKETEL